MPLALSFLRIVLAIFGVFWHCTNFSIFKTFLWKMPLEFIKDNTESTHGFGLYDHLNNINSSNLWTQDILPFLFMSSSSFIKVLVFSVLISLPPWLNLFLFLLFLILWNWFPLQIFCWYIIITGFISCNFTEFV